jgi:Spy/CpxP family protein refolding chaperone
MNQTSITLCATLLLAGATWAQDPQPNGQPPPSFDAAHGQPRPQMDPMAEYIFPPDLIMQKAQDIDLTEAQRQAIEAEMQKSQTHFGDLQKKLQGEMQALVSLIKQEKPDEDKVSSQLDKVLAAEGEIKKAQLRLMVRIKSQLTGQQQGQLRQIRREMMTNGSGQFHGQPGSDGERARLQMEQQRQ